MEWVSNAKFRQDVTEGTIFRSKGRMGITIHKICGLGNMLYLSCDRLGINQFGLNTDDFNTAVENARVIVRERMNMLNKYCNDFLSDESENVFVRY